MEKSEVHAVDMVRKIRDEQGALLSTKSEEEVLAFFRAAARRAQERAHEHQKAQARREEGA
jgi:hypothetical protein